MSILKRFLGKPHPDRDSQQLAEIMPLTHHQISQPWIVTTKATQTFGTGTLTPPHQSFLFAALVNLASAGLTCIVQLVTVHSTKLPVG